MARDMPGNPTLQKQVVPHGRPPTVGPAAKGTRRPRKQLKRLAPPGGASGQSNNKVKANAVAAPKPAGPVVNREPGQKLNATKRCDGPNLKQGQGRTGQGGRGDGLEGSDRVPPSDLPDGPKQQPTATSKNPLQPLGAQAVRTSNVSSKKLGNTVVNPVNLLALVRHVRVGRE